MRSLGGYTVGALSLLSGLINVNVEIIRQNLENVGVTTREDAMDFQRRGERAAASGSKTVSSMLMRNFRKRSSTGSKLDIQRYRLRPKRLNVGPNCDRRVIIVP